MKQTVYFADFTAAFHRMDRGTQFTYDGLRVLFDWLEEYEKRDFVRDYLNDNTMLCGETDAGDFVYLQF
jgi:hypothetical protein